MTLQTQDITSITKKNNIIKYFIYGVLSVSIIYAIIWLLKAYILLFIIGNIFKDPSISTNIGGSFFTVSIKASQNFINNKYDVNFIGELKLESDVLSTSLFSTLPEHIIITDKINNEVFSCNSTEGVIALKFNSIFIKKIEDIVSIISYAKFNANNIDVKKESSKYLSSDNINISVNLSKENNFQISNHNTVFYDVPEFFTQDKYQILYNLLRHQIYAGNINNYISLNLRNNNISDWQNGNIYLSLDIKKYNSSDLLHNIVLSGFLNLEMTNNIFEYLNINLSCDSYFSKDWYKYNILTTNNIAKYIAPEINDVGALLIPNLPLYGKIKFNLNGTVNRKNALGIISTDINNAQFISDIYSISIYKDSDDQNDYWKIDLVNYQDMSKDFTNYLKKIAFITNNLHISNMNLDYDLEKNINFIISTLSGSLYKPDATINITKNKHNNRLFKIGQFNYTAVLGSISQIISELKNSK